ncbi:uncharacterized protein TNCT_686001 [Trichonephila clavata]|uniref:Uncharacterized protein n=1 Tax=Trichonephila clavata TaxID=2740835 RepID=A0A8X6HDV0_TRICU|nr:uncharacterized protein TNCT_686001 [Trichonephila clavata]
MKKHYSLRNGLTVYEDDKKSSEKSNVEDEFHKKADSYQIFRGYFSEKVKSFSVRSKSNVPMLENPINDNKGRNNLEVISCQKPFLPMATNEKLTFQNKFVKSNYVLEFTSRFLEQDGILVSGQLSKWQNDYKSFSQNMVASQQEVFLKFVCLLNEAELRAFFNRADLLKINLGKLLEKYLQIQTNLAQINEHVNENSVVLYHRHFAVFLNILYFIKPSWILFPKNVILGDNLDVVSYENLNEIFPSKTGVECISSTSKISDNFHGSGLIFDHENSKYASKKLILNSELNSLPLFCNTSIKEVNNDQYQTDINSIISSDIDLITELQNCQQLLSHIENTYNLVKKRLESSLFIKFLALKIKTMIHYLKVPKKIYIRN